MFIRPTLLTNTGAAHDDASKVLDKSVQSDDTKKTIKGGVY